MADEAELSQSLARVAAEADRLRAQTGTMLREGVGQAAAQGLTQRPIADAIGRSQPEVSRLLRAYRDRRFRPSSPLGRVLVRHRDEIIVLARAHNVTNVRVFGSVLRGEDDAASGDRRANRQQRLRR